MKENNLTKIKKFIADWKLARAVFLAEMSKPRRAIFIILAWILSTYIVVTRFLMYPFIFDSYLMMATAMFLVAVLYTIIVFNVLLFVVIKTKNKGIEIKSVQDRIDFKTFWISAAVCLAVLGIILMAYYPGGISYDTVAQWRQVQSFTFDNWHPVAHTLMIWLVTQVFNYFPFVVLVQLVAFSAAVGYLIATLKAWGFNKNYLALVLAFIVLNPMTQNIMVYVWKDCALAIFVLILMTQMINIYLSGGGWLKSNKNIIVFSVCLVLATLVRHNSFFFTLPLFVLLFAYIKNWRQVLAVGVLAGCLLLAVEGPLYNALKVTYPNNTYDESIGLPMSIMGNVMKKHPERLDSETRQFLLKFASEEDWRTKAVTGSYSFKPSFASSSEILKNVPVKNFIAMVTRTIKNDPHDSFVAVRELTDMVWGTKGQNDWRLFVISSFFSDEVGYNYHDTLLKDLGLWLAAFLGALANIPLLLWLFMSTGVQMLALMMVGLFSYYRNGFKTLGLVVPSVAYNLGTMLLLAGPDYRFFYFNAVITLPLCLVLLAKQKQPGVESQAV